MSYRVLDTKNGVSLVDFSIDKFARHLPRLMLTHMLSPILGDRIYWRRLMEVDGAPELISAGSRVPEFTQWIPRVLLEKFAMNNKEIMTSLPIYCHVYNTIFEDVGGYEEQGLVAASEPPAHFMAALELLDLLPAYLKFKKQSSEKSSDDSTSETSKTSGDVIF
ncbi:hypothetical protein L3Y34_008898 [Caenorhabditis briggsae]|nr:hypothetical protein L3Y34_008898 [Caenorhabditis briggsae]